MSPAGASLKLAKCKRLIACQLKHHMRTAGKPKEHMHATHVRAISLPPGTDLQILARTVHYDGWIVVLHVNNLA